MQEMTRVSNGLKEFLWNLTDWAANDAGSRTAWQTTLSFFIERGFRVTSDDLLRSWKEFMSEENPLKECSGWIGFRGCNAGGRATRFIEENLQYKEEPSMRCCSGIFWIIWSPPWRSRPWRA